MVPVDLFHLSIVSIAAICAMLLAAGATKGLIGIGMPIVALPLLNLVVDLPVAVAILSIPLIISNIPQALTGDKASVVLKRLLPLLGGLVIGTVVGVCLLTSVRVDVLKPIVGVILIVVVGLMFCAPQFAVPQQHEKYFGPVVGLFGGILGGLAALPGPFVFVYILALGFSKDRFVQYSSMFLVVAATLMTVTLRGFGALELADLLGSMLAVIPILVGMRLGTGLRTYLSPPLFRKIILAVVMLSGIHMISGPVAAAVASAMH
jgi:uncharacterized membrane protein YfcA